MEAASEALGEDPELVRPFVEQALAGEAGQEAMRSLVAELVAAATAPAGGTQRVEVAQHLAPVATQLASQAQLVGVQVERDQVDRALASLDPIVLERDGGRPPVGPSSTATYGLGLATVIALTVAAVSGSGLLATAEDRRRELRSLVSRVAVSGLTFALLLRFGAWLADPSGGRAPVGSAVAGLLEAKEWIPVVVAGAAGAVWVVLWLRRLAPSRPAPPVPAVDLTRGAGSPTPAEPATRPPARLR